MIKITGVKKAIHDYNLCDVFRLHGRFYLDIVTGNIWCNVYPDCNSWDEYHDKNIHEFYPFEFADYEMLQDGKLTMKRLTETALKAIRHYERMSEYVPA